MYDIIIGRDEADRKRYGKKGTILLGKHYVKMGQTTSLSSEILMDITRSHVMFVCGKRGGGKSYTLGVIAEGLADVDPEIAQNLSIVILDTMGIYWTMKYPNKKEEELLREWNFEPHGLPVVIYTPHGFHKAYKEKGIPSDMPFSIKPTELAAADWCAAFDTSPNSDVGVLIEQVVFELKESGKEFGLGDLIDAVQKNTDSEKTTRAAAVNHFRNAEHWGLFTDNGTPLTELAAPGKITILDISCYATSEGGWAIKQMAVGIIAQKLFLHRMLARKDEEYEQVHKSENYFGEGDTDGKQEDPLVWLVIDEAHEFLPRDKTVASSDPLITILREGRQPGISLVLATQQPGKIHTDVLTQSDIVLSHRITAKLDTDALGLLMQSYMRAGLTEQLDDLPRVKGAGIIFDDTNEKMFPMRIRPRFTWHGGESPNAIPKKKKYFEN